MDVVGLTYGERSFWFSNLRLQSVTKARGRRTHSPVGLVQT